MSTRHGFSVRGLEVPGVSIRPRDGSAGCSPPGAPALRPVSALPNREVRPRRQGPITTLIRSSGSSCGPRGTAFPFRFE